MGGCVGRSVSLIKHEGKQVQNRRNTAECRTHHSRTLILGDLKNTYKQTKDTQSERKEKREDVEKENEESVDSGTPYEPYWDEFGKDRESERPVCSGTSPFLCSDFKENFDIDQHYEPVNHLDDNHKTMDSGICELESVRRSNNNFDSCYMETTLSFSRYDLHTTEKNSEDSIYKAGAVMDGRGTKDCVNNTNCMNKEMIEIRQQLMKIEYDDNDDMKDMTKLRMIINIRSDELFDKHSNLNAISASPIRSMWRRKEFSRTWCIVLYCSQKGDIPEGEESFPVSLDGYPVDVRSAAISSCHKKNSELQESSSFQQHLSAGAEIKVQNAKTGTLGGFVRIDEYNIGFITCGHLCFDDNQLELGQYNRSERVDQSLNISVYQPDDVGDLTSRKIGHVSRVSFTHGNRLQVSMDAALVTITNEDRKPEDGYFIKAKYEQYILAGFNTSSPPQFISGEVREPVCGQIVHKFGSQSSLTTGILVFDGMALRKENISLKVKESTENRIRMYNQMEIFQLAEKFFISGDSGSLVFQKDPYTSELFAVGMAIASTDYGGGIATPLHDVLRGLELPPTMLQFDAKLPPRERRLCYDYSSPYCLCTNEASSTNDGETSGYGSRCYQGFQGINQTASHSFIPPVPSHVDSFTNNIRQNPFEASSFQQCVIKKEDRPCASASHDLGTEELCIKTDTDAARMEEDDLCSRCRCLKKDNNTFQTSVNIGGGDNPQSRTSEPGARTLSININVKLQ